MFENLSTINRIIKVLAISNTTTVAAVGLFSPLFAVFLNEQLQTQNALQIIGIGSGLFLLTRSFGQLPVAFFIDKVKGERDDFWILFTGNCIYFVVPLLYLQISEAWHLYLVQIAYGVGAALCYPTWLALYTRHIDKGREGIEWGSYHTIADISGAAAASIGGLIASLFGFTAIMLLASLLALFGNLLLLLIRKEF
jgi:MFS family permease